MYNHVTLQFETFWYEVVFCPQRRMYIVLDSNNPEYILTQ
jgi:hypothetical protein